MSFDSDDVNVNNDDVITISFLLGGSSILILNFARRSVSPWKIMVRLAEKIINLDVVFIVIIVIKIIIIIKKTIILIITIIIPPP